MNVQLINIINQVCILNVINPNCRTHFVAKLLTWTSLVYYCGNVWRQTKQIRRKITVNHWHVASDKRNKHIQRSVFHSNIFPLVRINKIVC